MTIVKEKNNHYFLHEGMQVLISNEIIVKYNLLTKTYSDSKLLEIYNENLYKIAYEKSLSYLHSVKSEYELISHLKSLNIDDSNIKKVVLKLKELKLLDDRLFSKLYINSKISRYGKNYIMQELIKRRISKDIIYSELNLIDEKKYIQKKLNYYFMLEKGSIKNRKEKIKAKYYQKGYEIENIEKVVDEFFYKKNLDDLNLIKEDIKKISSKLRRDDISYKTKLRLKLLKLGYDYSLIDDNI